MRSLALTISLVFAALAGGQAADAQSMLTEHTYRLDEGTPRPAASLEDVGWLVGNWIGEGFGMRFEEVWNPPSAGSMVGAFKMLDGDGVAFYEFEAIVEEEGSLALRVRHFDRDFTAWEEKADYADFPLVDVAENALHFSGLSFYKIGPDELHSYLALTENGEVREEKLVYRRR